MSTIRTIIAVIALASLAAISSSCGSAMSESDPSKHADKPAGKTYLIGVTDMT